MTVFDKEAFDLIVSEEVTDQATYVKRYQTPEWPGASSGVTIGIGYDLGYVTRVQLHNDWGGYLSPAQLQRLETVVGMKGQSAKDSLWMVKGVVVPWDIAIKEFTDKVLPTYIDLTRRALHNFDKLPLKAQGALVSLVYNRGASFNNKGDRFSEMNNIRKFMELEQYDKVPNEIRSMKRLWVGTGVSGLVARREHEAKLFESGLKPAVAPVKPPINKTEVTAVSLLAMFVAAVAHQVQMHPFLIVLLVAALVGGVAVYFHKRGTTP